MARRGGFDVGHWILDRWHAVSMQLPLLRPRQCRFFLSMFDIAAEGPRKPQNTHFDVTPSFQSVRQVNQKLHTHILRRPTTQRCHDGFGE